LSKRDTIFIGHATPEDNEFTLWLQSKLIGEGYNCECDLSLLLGGEADYWKNLQDFLEERTIKYILVISRVTFKKGGVLDEWEHCKSIERQNKLKDFILPIKLDDAPFNSRIGLNRRNIVVFENNWSTGLKRLIKKLKNDNVPVNPDSNSLLSNWYENVYTNWSGIEAKYEDKFYSNWIEIPSVPKWIYFYKFKNEKQAKVILENNMVYPAFRHGNVIISFQKSLEYYLKNQDLKIEPTQIVEKHTNDAFSWYENDEFPTFHDFRRLLVRLLNTCFEMYLKGLDLSTYELSNSTCYFFEHDKNLRRKGVFKIADKTHKIGVTGKFYDDFWHYGISFRTILHPELCISIKNHIIFTEDGKKAWDDDKKMHRARRKKGKRMFNKEWRNQMLAFLSLLSNNEESNISIPVNEQENINLSTTPIIFEAHFGYNEPNDKERIIPIDDYLEDEELYEDDNNKLKDA
jgi:hypothetical protein